MDTLHFIPLADPTPAHAEAFTRWENDPALIPLARPNQSQADLERRQIVTVEQLAQRLAHDHIYLIFLDGQLVGEMNYQIDPGHLFKREPGTAWLGITIGEAAGRGKGIGRRAITYLEQQIQERGLPRIELGVFAFNAAAHALYQKLGYQEIGRIPAFTYWEGTLWPDIRMEKYLAPASE